MPRVHITGSRKGFQTVSVVSALQSYCGMSLTEAKRQTEDVLAGSPVTVMTPNSRDGDELATRLDALGAVATVLPDGAAA